MANKINLRELVLNILLEIDKEGQYSHLVLRNTLEKYQYLEKKERLLSPGYARELWSTGSVWIISWTSFPTVPADKMKPVIRELLRSSVYQLLYMDHVPDSAVCNEAVKLARKRGFYNLTGFVNGVLRRIVREYGSIHFPKKTVL